jgi:hypothetical protein
VVGCWWLVTETRSSASQIVTAVELLNHQLETQVSENRILSGKLRELRELRELRDLNTLVLIEIIDNDILRAIP